MELVEGHKGHDSRICKICRLLYVNRSCKKAMEEGVLDIKVVDLLIGTTAILRTS